MNRPTRLQQVLSHMLTRGHISEGTALIEYGRFRLSDVIYRLRTDAAHLLPEDKEIVTIHKKDTQGNSYGEYHLVTKASAAARKTVLEAREAEEASRLQDYVRSSL